MIFCAGCGSTGRVLTRGLCEVCDPHVHAAHEAALGEYRRRATDYTTETGKTPLEDWEAFESWCNRRGLGAIG